MVECDGLCAMDKPEAFAEAMGHILWEANINKFYGDKWGDDNVHYHGISNQ
jgi:hypothetical protein